MHHDAAGFDPAAAPFDETTGGFDAPERTYPVDPHAPIVLDLACDSADVSVRATARLDVLVRALGAGDRPGTADSPPGLHVSADGNRIAVSTRVGDPSAPNWSGGPGNHRDRRRGLGGWLSFGRFAHEFVTAVEVETPVGAALQLTLLSGAGDVRLDGLGGELTIRAGSGDLSASNCAAQIQADAGSGDVRLAGCVGAARVQTGSGDVSVERGSLDAGRFRSGSGDLALRDVGLGTGPFEIQTGAGDVVLDVYRTDRLDEPIGLRYVALSGDATIGAGFARLRGRAAEGAQPLVTVHTASGDLHARRTAAPAAASAPANDHDDEAWAAATRIPVAVAPPRQAPPAPPVPPMALTPNPPGSPVPDPEAAAPGVASAAHQRIVGDMSPEAAAADVPPTDDPRIALLEAVARGELDIDEALRRLG